ncbi:MAG: lipase family alpha/beta hydrolase [Anaerolineae bacterium]|nr:hypothetical protein [Chloroflexota bacterium]
MPELTSSWIRWLLSQTESLLPERVHQSAWASTVDTLLASAFGGRESANLHALLEPIEDDASQRSTILIPGIMGSLLGSTRGKSALLWLNPALLVQGALNLLDLDGDGRDDANPEVEVVPFGIEKMTYLPLIETLARRSQLLEFPYDWRHNIVVTAHRLHAAILRWSSGVLDKRFTIVCHSMGGLVARCYMALYPREAERQIEQVLMIGVPLHGAAVAALAFSRELHPYLLVANVNPGNDLAGFSRTLPSTYQLLPPPADEFPADPVYPFDWDIYDARAWPIQGLSQAHLNTAAATHRLMRNSDPQLPLYNFAGCHMSTVTQIYLDDTQPEGLRPEYVAQGEQSGDGQVPLWSSRATNVATHYVEEDHVALVRNQRVLADVSTLLAGGQPSLPTVVPRRQSTVERWTGLPLHQQLVEMRNRIESETLTRIDLDHLFFWR